MGTVEINLIEERTCREAWTSLINFIVSSFIFFLSFFWYLLNILRMFKRKICFNFQFESRTIKKRKDRLSHRISRQTSPHNLNSIPEKKSEKGNATGVSKDPVPTSHTRAESNSKTLFNVILILNDIQRDFNSSESAVSRCTRERKWHASAR